MRLTADVIAGFSASLLQKNFDGAVESPECHYEWWTLCCEKHPLVAIAAPRRHAKSTAITFTYTLAAVCFRERSYVLLVSDTVSQAVQFLGNIKKELLENDQLRSLFGIKELLKESEDDIIVACEDGHKFRIQAKGSEQAVRGLIWNNKRPDLIVCDDLENDEIVLNKDRRAKFRRWFYGALLPCRSNIGIVRYVGTILHSDSMLESIMPKLNDRYTRTNELKTWNVKTRQTWLSVKYKAHNPELTNFLWETQAASSLKAAGMEGGAKEYFIHLRQGYVDQGIPDVYSQEYLNIPIDESLAYFQRSGFNTMTVEDRQRRVEYYITADLAISKDDTADYSVFLVAGVDNDGMIYVKNVIRERMDGKEIVDTILELERVYKPLIFGIEEMQVTKAIGPFLNEAMVRQDTYPNLKKLKHGGKDKIARARSIQARMRAERVKFNKNAEWYQAFEDELLAFPRGKHDDQVDAFAYLGMMLASLVEAPTEEEYEEEQYLEELHEHGSQFDGRNAVTGY